MSFTSCSFTWFIAVFYSFTPPLSSDSYPLLFILPLSWKTPLFSFLLPEQAFPGAETVQRGSFLLLDPHDQNHRFSIVLSQGSITFNYTTAPLWDVTAWYEEMKSCQEQSFGMQYFDWERISNTQFQHYGIFQLYTQRYVHPIMELVTWYWRI